MRSTTTTASASTEAVAKTLVTAPGANDQVTATGKVWAITGNPVFRMNRPGKVNFYGIGGAGVYQRRIWISVTRITGTSSQTSSATQIASGFGINFGGGMTFDAFKGFKGYVEARYHHAFTKNYDTQLLPISIGIRW